MEISITGTIRKRARPLHPRCVSSVDSGNLLACLIAAKEAVSEFSSDKKEELKERMLKLASAIDLRPLYDKKRKLFYISRDAESGRTSSGVYDLMASEARILSYGRGGHRPGDQKALGEARARSHRVKRLPRDAFLDGNDVRIPDAEPSDAGFTGTPCCMKACSLPFTRRSCTEENGISRSAFRKAPFMRSTTR